MIYQQLGRSGLLVSRTCLGTMTFGNDAWGCDAAESRKLTTAFIEAGGNFIDTADLYAKTVSESILGTSCRTTTATPWSSPPNVGFHRPSTPTLADFHAGISSQLVRIPSVA